MKKLILLSLTLLNSYGLLGQICGTPQPVNPVIYPDIRNYPDNRNAGIAGASFCIDVFFHIVRNSDGTKASPIPHTDTIVKELNKVYSTHNIIINNAGKDFIDNSNNLSIDIILI